MIALVVPLASSTIVERPAESTPVMIRRAWKFSMLLVIPNALPCEPLIYLDVISH